MTYGILRDIKTVTVKKENTTVFFDLEARQATPSDFDKKFGETAMKAIIEFDEQDDGQQNEYHTVISYYNKKYDVSIKL